MKIWLYPLVIISLFLYSCQSGNEKKTAETNFKDSIKVPEFNADSAYQHIATQLSFGPRVPNTKAQKECAVFLEQKIRSYLTDVIIQKAKLTAYNNSKLDMINIIASYKPNTANRVLLCSHWDSRPYADWDTKDKELPIPGANDGASGVGVLLEIARQISINKPNVGIDIIFLDVEDYGPPEYGDTESKEEYWCLGTQYWAKNLHKAGYTANYGILLDMVGAKGATFYKEGNSMKYAASVVNKVWETGNRLGYADYFIYDNAGEMRITDDHIPINEIAKIPCIDIIHLDPSGRTGFADYWHTHQDNMAGIDKNTLKAVGQTLLEVLFRE